ncbi:MAG: hypothetical protein J7J94_02350 [Thaumarchaeota archaeon]|nr:hypothetical protein [Nitrososphaerota archaeon]
MFGETFVALSGYFLRSLLASIGFLIAFILTWSSRSRVKERARGLTYASIGFLIGFLGTLITGFLGAYVYRLPILPLILRGQGMSAQKIAETILLYNLAFDAAHLASTLTALILAGYGIHRFVVDLKTGHSSTAEDQRVGKR